MTARTVTDEDRRLACYVMDSGFRFTVVGEAAPVARWLAAMGYGHDDDITSDDLARAAEDVGASVDTNDDHAMLVLDIACDLVRSAVVR